LGDKILSSRIQTLGDILGEVHEEFSDSLKKSFGEIKKLPQRNPMISISLGMFMTKIQ